MRKKFWLTLDGPIGPVPVYVVKKLKCGSDGDYDAVKNRIRIAQNIPEVMLSTLAHEMLHACIGQHSSHVKRAVGIKSRKVEERIVGTFEIPLVRMLFPLLRIPAPPKL